MRRSVFSAFVTALALALALTAANASGARAQDADAALQRVTVVQGATASNLQPIAPGLVDWISEQLGMAGVDVTDGTAARIETQKLRRDARGRPVGTRALLAAAQLSGGDLAIITDLRFDHGRIELLLRTHRVTDGRLIGSGRASAAATKIALAANASIDRVLPVLGHPKRGRGEEEHVDLDQLSLRSRALDLMDEGDVTRAWAELEGESGPTVDLMRERIVETAERPEVADLQKARLLAARGDAEGAWRTVAREASEQLYAPAPDVDLLVAAGEIQMQRDRMREARAYFERVLEIQPEHPDALVGLGKTLAEEDDPVGARDAYARARRARPDSVKTADALTSVGAPLERAAAHMEAGKLAGEMLQAGSATHHFQEAARLDPSIAASAADELGGLSLDVGEGQAAAGHFETAIATGGESADRQLGLGEALETLKEVQGAQHAYMRALELDPNDPDAMMKLGDIYLQKDEPHEARAILEQAVATNPASADAKKGLAKALNAQGKFAEAVPLLVEAQELEGDSVDGLRELSDAQRKLGDLGAAEDALKKAIRLDPTNAGLRDELAAVYEEGGKDEAAAKQRSFVDLLGGAETLQADMGGGRGLNRSDDPFVASMQELVEGFAPMMPGLDRVVVLGVSENLSVQDRILEWFWPMSLDKHKFAAALQQAVDPHYDRVTQPLFQALPPGSLSAVFDFESRRALDAGTIAAMNEAMISDAMFAAVISRPTILTPGRCGEDGGMRIELRRLGGQVPAEVQILAHEACIPGGLLAHGKPNYKAALPYLVLLGLSLIPTLRGFGSVAVLVSIPEDTKSLFSASVTARPRNVVSSAKTTKENAKGEFNQHLRKLKRGEKRVENGEDTIFSWLLARKKPYYVTVRGPLIHSVSGELVGDFLEERRVLVKRGHQSRVEFDLRPKDCPVEVKIQRGDTPVKSAAIAIKGQLDSNRFASGGSAFVYLGHGDFTIVIGDDDRVAERPVSVKSFSPMVLTVDMSQQEGCLFTGCPEAVTPYVEGDYAGAADALERAGLKEPAHEIRAAEFQRAGRIVEASRELAAAGRKQDAAALLDEHEVGQESAQLYEEAGEYGRAARIHAEAGDWLAAARNFEAAEDYERAIKCYDKLGETDTVLSLMEKSGDHLGAGKVCLQKQEIDRAIHNFQQVGRSDLNYAEVSRELGVILAERGNVDFALEKFDEASQIDGIDEFDVTQAEIYGSLLEQNGRKSDALEALSAVRRKDLNYRDVNTRIETLKASITADEEATRVNESSASGSMPPLGASPGETGLGSAESRYEILDELGRGGMGIVYKARDTHLGRIVALKRLPDNLKNHPAAVKFFEREARSAAALNHPNIVTIFDAGQEADTYFISMEMLEGTPLDDVMEKHRILPPIVVARLGIQISTGLAYAHRNKIIHRDIKTANLFLTRDKIVKIMDFGLAKMVEEVRKGATVIGGTPYYMAPEQATGESVDHRADLYALGITLYQMSTGNLPFTEGDITYHHRNTPPPDPRSFKQDLPAPLAELILRLIEKDPNARIQTADEVVQLLQSVVEASSKAAAQQA